MDLFAGGGLGGLLDKVGGFLSKPVGGSAQPGMNGLGLIGAVLRDANSGGRGTAVSEFGAAKSAAMQEQKRAEMHQRIKNAMATGDMNQVRQVLMDAAAAGEDISHITNALKFGQPQYSTEDPTKDIFQTDPITGERKQVRTGTPAARRPIIAGGMQSMDEGKTWQAIPGFVDQQRLLSGARRGPIKPKAPAGGVLQAPWTMFGGGN